MRHPLNAGYRITQGFSQAHPGNDYAPPTRGQTGVGCYAPERSKVVASSTGKVEGNYVIIQGLDTGKFYYFGHFATRAVNVGQTISEGTLVGILGMTGSATGIHTHCEVRDARNASFAGKRDPESWFKNKIAEQQAAAQGGKKMTRAEAEAVVNALFANLLPGNNDANGKKIYTDHVLAGNVNFVVKDISSSQEFKNNHTKTVQGPERVVEKIVEKPVGSAATPEQVLGGQLVELIKKAI